MWTIKIKLKIIWFVIKVFTIISWLVVRYLASIIVTWSRDQWSSPNLEMWCFRNSEIPSCWFTLLPLYKARNVNCKFILRTFWLANFVYFEKVRDIFLRIIFNNKKYSITLFIFLLLIFNLTINTHEFILRNSEFNIYILL